MPAALLWAVPAALAYAGLYAAAGDDARLTLRRTGACALIGATLITLLAWRQTWASGP
ncbi:hypothetical protein ACH4E7_06920 [Kitasatospora sp. NPDC018058]|uniref:hypothetical protein n=1 Tax=Kitasatospora sp. NPDC018058 TaxID=3364025 RepID=UPI0037BFB862